MADRHIAGDPGDTSQDMVTRDVTDPWQEICDLRDEIERLQAEVRMLCRRCRMGCHEAHGVVCDECKEARRG